MRREAVGMMNSETIAPHVGHMLVAVGMREGVTSSDWERHHELLRVLTLMRCVRRTESPSTMTPYTSVVGLWGTDALPSDFDRENDVRYSRPHLNNAPRIVQKTHDLWGGRLDYFRGRYLGISWVNGAFYVLNHELRQETM